MISFPWCWTDTQQQRLPLLFKWWAPVGVDGTLVSSGINDWPALPIPTQLHCYVDIELMVYTDFKTFGLCFETRNMVINS
jgi:hypothetical protein